MDGSIKGKVLKSILGLFPAEDNEKMIYTNGQTELLSAASSGNQEIIRQGHSFCLTSLILQLSDTTIPSTVAALGIYNNEPDGGRNYIIDRCWAELISSSIPQTLHFGLIGLLGQRREAPPSFTAIEANCLSTLSGSGTFGTLDTRVRLLLPLVELPITTGITGYWKPLGNSIKASAAVTGLQVSYDTKGRFIVPPGRYFAINIICSHTSQNFRLGIEWTEKYLQSK